MGNQEVEDYFNKTVKPAAEAAHPGQLVTLEDYRDQIERRLTGQRADQQMDTWLREVRRAEQHRGARRGAEVRVGVAHAGQAMPAADH